MTKFDFVANHLGKKYNKLTVLEIKKQNKQPTRAICACECGVVKEYLLTKIVRNRTKACGCQKNNQELRDKNRIKAYELIRSNNSKFGKDNHPKENREFKFIHGSIRRSRVMKKIGIDQFNVTIEDLKQVWDKQNGICKYTGIKLTLPIHSKKRNPDVQYKMASVDRIDSSKPYTADNIQFVSRSINYAKNTMTDQEMRDFIALIRETKKD
jgi:hypothetical protein